MGKHVMGVLVKNHAGVLSRVTGLFSRRVFNIDSLAVGTTQDPEISRITIVVNGDSYTVDQVAKQLDKLIDVIEVEHLYKEESVTRELMLIKVKATSQNRSEIIQLVEVFRSNIVDVSATSLTIEVSGGSSKLEALIEMLKPFGIIEVVRTGVIAISRGE